MRRVHLIALRRIACLLLSVVACRGRRTPDRQQADLDAEQRMALFLDARVEHSTFDAGRYWSCPPDFVPKRRLALADYRVLSSAQRQDTVIAETEVTSVAEETLGSGRYHALIVAQRVQVDTLHWKLVRDTQHGHWGVCGYSIEGYDIGLHVPPPGEDISWRPEGASLESVRQLAESVRAAARR